MYKYQIKLKILNKIPKLKINQTNKFITQILFELLIAKRSTLFNLLKKFVITTLWFVERKKGEWMFIFISSQQFSELKTFSSSFFLFFSKCKNHRYLISKLSQSLESQNLDQWSESQVETFVISKDSSCPKYNDHHLCCYGVRY